MHYPISRIRPDLNWFRQTFNLDSNIPEFYYKYRTNERNSLKTWIQTLSKQKLKKKKIKAQIKIVINPAEI